MRDLFADTSKIAWVTGATGYWGRKVCLSLLRQGWTVVALCRQKPAALLAWAESQGQRLTWQPLDFEAFNWLEPLVQLPEPQAFFHCSGLFDENLERMLKVNVVQPVQLIEFVVRRMKAQPCGRVGILLGQNGRLGLPGLGAFSGTQGALWTWSEALARGLKKEQSSVSLTLVFPARAPSVLQSGLAEKLEKAMKLKPPATADQLVLDVLNGKRRAGRRPLPAGLLTLLT